MPKQPASKPRQPKTRRKVAAVEPPPLEPMVEALPAAETMAPPAPSRTPRSGRAAAVNGAGARPRRTPRRTRKGAQPTRPAPRRQTVPEPPPELPLGGAEAEAAEVPQAELGKEMIEELDAMIKRLRAMSPGYNPPPFSPRSLLELIEQNVDKLPPGLMLGILGKLRKTIGEDLFDADTWKGMWYMLNYTLEYQTDVVKRRLTGEYETDPWGLDREFLGAVRPFFDFMYKRYWRVTLSGVENVPAEGRAMLVVNHSGQLPWDASMLATGVLLEHPSQRLVRSLYATWFPTLPFVADILVKCGQVLATDENGQRLLEQEELVAVYPEGYKGVGKLYRDRYRLARFGRGGFVRMALRTGAPMLPVAVVGAEETYVSLAKSDLLAKLTGFPYFPISPTWPWMGLLGFIPLPTKWYIDIGEPIAMDGYGPGAADDVMVVSQLTDQMRNLVQQMIFKRLAQRRSVFLG